jgi:Spy/CpxP family protein refolding chaperone
MKPLDVAPTARGLRRFVLALAVGVAGSIGLAAWAQPHGPGMMGGPGFMMGHGVERALGAVGASDAQRAQVKQIMQAAMADLRAQHAATRELRQQTMQLFTQPTVDANAAEALRQKMLAQHDAASKRMLQAMLDVSRVLTPEQRAQLAERMQRRGEMMQRHEKERRQLDAPKS